MEFGRILIPLCEAPLAYRLLEAANEVLSSGEAVLQVACCQRETAAAIAFSSELVGLEIETFEDVSTRTRCDAESLLCDWAGQKGHKFSKETVLTDGARVSFIDHVGEPLEIIERLGRLSDLIVCSKSDEDSAISRSVLETCLLRTGRPVLAIPRLVPTRVFEHVLIAWDGSLAASRMLSQILPMLRLARKVSIFTYPERDCRPTRIGNIQEYLSYHGISAKTAILQHHLSICDALIGTTIAEGVTLVAMGAYGHGKVRELTLGGLSRFMLAKGSIPLLMAH